MIKSERLRATTSSTGTPSIIGLMPGSGVEWGRLGANDPFIALPVTYDMPVPYVNVVFANGFMAGEGVMSMPFSSKTIIVQPVALAAFPRFRKPILARAV